MRLIDADAFERKMDKQERFREKNFSQDFNLGFEYAITLMLCEPEATRKIKYCPNCGVKLEEQDG